MLTGLSSCNSKTEEELEGTISTEVEVTDFYLKANSKVMSNLDSVFFSLDLDNGLIYNADSLPVGTSVDKLIPMITYPSTVTKATITMSGGTTREGDVDYLTNPSDSIDFTGKVYFTLVAEDGSTSKTYQIKVNVHKMDPDSLWWDNMAVAKLPSRLSSPKNQKSLSHADKVYSLIEESDGSYTMSSTSHPHNGVWSKQMPEFTFVPELRSFTATEDKFYILSQQGELYSSADGLTWSNTGNVWLSIVGGFGTKLQGIRYNGSENVHTQYPLDGFTEYALESNFPVSGFSAMGSYSSQWADDVLGLITGGRCANGSYIGSTWAYDGEQWANISNLAAPATVDGTLIPYYAYLQNGSQWLTNEFSVWLYIGGKLADGSLNRDVYMSYDNGVNWILAPDNMALPEYMPTMQQIDFAVVDTPMQASFAPEVWSQKGDTAKRIIYDINGYEISWNCPYIYLFGGCNANGTLYNTIWRGVINRMSFKPLI
jgi:hypothetical protein